MDLKKLVFTFFLSVPIISSCNTATPSDKINIFTETSTMIGSQKEIGFKTSTAYLISTNTPHLTNTPEASETPISALHSFEVIFTKNANCRSEPRTESNEISYFLKGEVTVAIARSLDENNLWLYVTKRSGVDKCWVSAFVVENTKELLSLPVIEDEVTIFSTSTLVISPSTSNKQNQDSDHIINTPIAPEPVWKGNEKYPPPGCEYKSCSP